MTLTSRNLLSILTIWYSSLLTTDAIAGHGEPSTTNGPVDFSDLELMNPKNGFVFMKILENEDVLLPILNSAFEENFSNIMSMRKNTIYSYFEYTNNIGFPVSFDIYCKTQENRSVIVEIQLVYKYEKSFPLRSVCYMSKAYTSQLDEMELSEKETDDDALRPVYFLEFADVNLFPKKEHFISTHVLKDQSTNEMDIKELKFTFVELQKLKNKRLTSYEQLHTDLEKFAYFLLYDFKNSLYVEILSNLVQNNGWIKKALEASNKLSWGRKDNAKFDIFVDAFRNFQDVIDTAYEEEGRKQEKKKTIMRCNELGYNTTTIANIVRLSEEEVKKIIQNSAKL